MQRRRVRDRHLRVRAVEDERPAVLPGRRPGRVRDRARCCPFPDESATVVPAPSPNAYDATKPGVAAWLSTGAKISGARASTLTQAPANALSRNPLRLAVLSKGPSPGTDVFAQWQNRGTLSTGGTTLSARGIGSLLVAAESLRAPSVVVRRRRRSPWLPRRRRSTCRRPARSRRRGSIAAPSRSSTSSGASGSAPALATRGRRPPSFPVASSTSRARHAASPPSISRAERCAGGTRSSAASRGDRPRRLRPRVVGTTDTSVFALSAAGGRLLWDRPLLTRTERRIESAPLVANGLVYASTVGDRPGRVGALYALDAATGRVVWRVSTVKEPFPQPAEAGGGGARYPPSSDGRTLYWGTTSPLPHGGTALRSNGGSYPGPVPDTDSLLALNARTGGSALARPGDEPRRPRLRLPALARARPCGRRACRFRRRVGAWSSPGTGRRIDRLWQTKVGVHKNDHGRLPW